MGSPKGVGESSRDRLRRQLAERTGTRAKDWHVVFKAYLTDLPRYHTFLPLHPSASFIMHDSV